MNSIVIRAGLVAAVVAAAVALAGVGVAEEEEMETKPTVADLAWLAGAWTSEDGSFEEHWLPPAGGTMAAVSRMIRGDRTVMYELSAIETAADGGLALRIRHFDPGLASWKSEAEGPQTWPLARAPEREAVFEDPARPFPRRIVYRLTGEDRMEARLEGERDGKPDAVVFRFRR